MVAKKLKSTEVKAYRERLVDMQGNVCPLCLTELLYADAVLDHDHDTGKIRFALHRSCNHAEGNVKNWANRTRAKNKKDFVERVLAFWEMDLPDTTPIHPSFKSPEDKRLKVLKKRLKTVKLATARQRIEREIRQIKIKQS